MVFHNLTIKKTILETPDTVSLYFEVPSDLRTNYNFIPGQYLTLSIEIGGNEIRRAYSICTSPENDDVAVSVKLVEGGLMSTHIHNKVKEGMSINVSTPEGKFICKVDENVKRDHYFITAGSGITPIMSMIPYILEQSPMSNCYLLYGSRDEDHIIFKQQLEELESKYKGQFFLSYTLSKPIKEKGLFGIFKKSTWEGLKGRVDAKKIESFLESHPDKSKSSQFYLCGPGDLIDNTEIHLLGRGINANNISKEHFTTSTMPQDKSKPSSTTESGQIIPSKITAHLNNEVVVFDTNGKKTILDELLDLKKNPPYSCTSGACSSCMAKVVKGSVVMEECYALDEGEIADNYILTCQARPTSTEVEIVYE